MRKSKPQTPGVLPAVWEPVDPLVEDPAEYLWAFIRATVENEGFQFLSDCAADLQERIREGVKANRIGLYEFRERRLEAEQNLVKLLRTMISEERSKDSMSNLLSQSGLFSAIYGCNLCPGLWPLC